jgi:hypothetical protein
MSAIPERAWMLGPFKRVGIISLMICLSLDPAEFGIRGH